MRIVPVDNLLDHLRDIPFALVFPFDSLRSARSGDPSIHGIRDALDLFVIALVRLVAHLGEPDSPDADRNPDIGPNFDLVSVTWDFDYYVLKLEVSREAPRDDCYSVCLRGASERAELARENSDPSESAPDSGVNARRGGPGSQRSRPARSTRSQKPHNPGMQPTNSDAAQSVLRPLCLLSEFAADSHVRHIKEDVLP